MKETMDKVLEFLQKDRPEYEKEKILYRPDKGRSIVGFIFSVVFFFIMFMFCIFKFSLGFVILLAISVGMLIFYGANTFTKNGIYIQKFVDKRLIDKLDDEIDEDMEDDVIDRKEQE